MRIRGCGGALGSVYLCERRVGFTAVPRGRPLPLPPLSPSPLPLPPHTHAHTHPTTTTHHHPTHPLALQPTSLCDGWVVYVRCSWSDFVWTLGVRAVCGCEVFMVCLFLSPSRVRIVRHALEVWSSARCLPSEGELPWLATTPPHNTHTTSHECLASTAAHGASVTLNTPVPCRWRSTRKKKTKLRDARH